MSFAEGNLPKERKDRFKKRGLDRLQFAYAGHPTVRNAVGVTPYRCLNAELKCCKEA